MNSCYCNWNIEEKIGTYFHFIFTCGNKMIATAVTIKNICKLFDFSFYWLSFLFHSKKYFQKILLLKQNTTWKKSTLHIFNTTVTTDCYQFSNPVKLKVITLIQMLWKRVTITIIYILWKQYSNNDYSIKFLGLDVKYLSQCYI